MSSSEHILNTSRASVKIRSGHAAWPDLREFGLEGLGGRAEDDLVRIDILRLLNRVSDGVGGYSYVFA
jgi:hypothetical protein